MKASYTLRFPFQLPPVQQISGLDQPIEREFEGLKFRFQHQAPFYVLTIQGFGSEELAKEYLTRLWSGLMWVLLNRGISCNANLKFDIVTDVDNPQQPSHIFGVPFKEKIDGMTDGSRPVVYPSDKQILFATAGSATIVGGTGIELVDLSRL